MKYTLHIIGISTTPDLAFDKAVSLAEEYMAENFAEYDVVEAKTKRATIRDYVAKGQTETIIIIRDQPPQHSALVTQHCPIADSEHNTD